jgi:hypothetical protein
MTVLLLLQRTRSIWCQPVPRPPLRLLLQVPLLLQQLLLVVCGNVTTLRRAVCTLERTPEL